MCHPSDVNEISVPEDPLEETELPENVPEEIIHVHENVLNQGDSEGHIVEINGVEYIYCVEN